MSIQNIKKLKQFGIFQNHTNAYATDFGKYNLFYGWNGSGKSTLSGLFRCIENKARPEKFPASEFTVSIENGNEITQENITESDLTVYTFNQEFIDENISWNSVVKSILLVDKLKIVERENLEALKKAQQADVEAHKKESDSIDHLKGVISKFGTDSARLIKTSLQSIDTTDAYYMNYDKRKFEAFIEANIEATKTDAPLLAEDKIVELTDAAKPDQKNLITFAQQTISQENLTKAKDALDDLLRTSVVSKILERLADNEDIKSWVEVGLDLHIRHDTKRCEFCGNNITVERTEQLEAHFNDNYKAFQERLVKADDWLSGQYLQAPLLPAASDFYEEFKKQYNGARTALEEATKEINEEIYLWHTVLKEKTKNQHETGLKVEAIKELSIKRVNDAMIKIGEIIEKHNNKSANFKEETNKAKKQLDLHYATTEVKLFRYHAVRIEIADRAEANNALKVNIENRKAQIQTLEDSLSNEGLGAGQFNESLRKFLGRSEISLRFNKLKKGYEILRNDSDLVDGNLSEGEKTAIAFVYFIILVSPDFSLRCEAKHLHSVRVLSLGDEFCEDIGCGRIQEKCWQRVA